MTTFSIFDSSGNLIDAFNHRGAALDRLAAIAQAERAAADATYLIAQDSRGDVVGGPVYASAVAVPA
jgi:hypothetical protein